jgi:small subunit ribosomal protein S6
MRKYETVIIIPPNLGEAAVDAVVTGVEADIRDRCGGQNLAVNRWGKQNLAYPIRKFTEGYYVLYEYESDGQEVIGQLQGRLRINEGIVRFLTIRRDEELRTEARLKERTAKRKKHGDDMDDSDSFGEDYSDVE